MDIGPDTRLVPNPARLAARKTVKAAEAELVAAERALPQLLNGQGTPKQMNAALPGAHQRIRDAQTALAEAKAALKPIPAKVLATDLDPDAKRARPRLARRGLQMVLRLLAFNAEAWLAEHLNAYLADPNEYRATTRHLLHLGGHVAVHPHRDHRDPGPARQPPSRPRPTPARRRAQRHPGAPARRPPRHHLPRHAGMNLNNQPEPYSGGLRLRSPSGPCGSERVHADRRIETA